MYVYSAHQIPESVGDDNYNNAATSYPGDDNNNDRGNRDGRDDLDEDEDDGIVSEPNILASVDLTKTVGGL
jgi:hypothetical protein